MIFFLLYFIFIYSNLLSSKSLYLLSGLKTLRVLWWELRLFIALTHLWAVLLLWILTSRGIKWLVREQFKYNLEIAIENFFFFLINYINDDGVEAVRILQKKIRDCWVVRLDGVRLAMFHAIKLFSYLGARQVLFGRDYSCDKFRFGAFLFLRLQSYTEKEGSCELKGEACGKQVMRVQCGCT